MAAGRRRPNARTGEHDQERVHTARRSQRSHIKDTLGPLERNGVISAFSGVRSRAFLPLQGKSIPSHLVGINWKAKDMNEQINESGQSMRDVDNRATPTGWEHLTPDEMRLLHETASNPASWWVLVDEESVEPIIGWSVVFPKDDTLAELLFRTETAARQAAAAIPNALVSTFSTPDASWHHWEDQA
ncbi:MAG TPA: hypothetical protein VIU11_18795 [Nakamurella sp.]